MTNIWLFIFPLAVVYILAGISYIHLGKQTANPTGPTGGMKKFLGVPPKVWSGLALLIVTVSSGLLISNTGEFEILFTLLLVITPLTLLGLIFALFTKNGWQWFEALVTVSASLSIVFLISAVFCLISGFEFPFTPLVLVTPVGFILMFVAYRFLQHKPKAVELPVEAVEVNYKSPNLGEPHPAQTALPAQAVNLPAWPGWLLLAVGYLLAAAAYQSFFNQTANGNIPVDLEFKIWNTLFTGIYSPALPLLWQFAILFCVLAGYGLISEIHERRKQIIFSGLMLVGGALVLSHQLLILAHRNLTITQAFTYTYRGAPVFALPIFLAVALILAGIFFLLAGLKQPKDAHPAPKAPLVWRVLPLVWLAVAVGLFIPSAQYTYDAWRNIQALQLASYGITALVGLLALVSVFAWKKTGSMLGAVIRFGLSASVLLNAIMLVYRSGSGNPMIFPAHYLVPLGGYVLMFVGYRFFLSKRA